MYTDVKYDLAYVWPEPGSSRASQLLDANFEYHTSGAGVGFTFCYNSDSKSVETPSSHLEA